MDHLCYLRLVFDMLSLRFITALWSPAGKELTSWLSFVMFVFLSLSHVVSWVRCGTWLYQFLIFATFLTVPCKPGVASSIPGFSSLSDETLASPYDLSLAVDETFNTDKQPQRMTQHDKAVLLSMQNLKLMNRKIITICLSGP